MENNLPKRWEITILGEIATWGSGGTPKATEKKYFGGDIPWLVIGDLNDGYITKSEKKITELGLKESSAKLVPKGAVLVAMYGSIGKLGIAQIECTTNQAIAFTHKIHGGISNRYLFYYLFSQKKNLLEIGKGGTQANISQTVLKEYPIPIPPLREQNRIVAKLDSMLDRVAASKSRLDKIPILLKNFRKSVMAAAVCGELTKEWRSNNQQIEPAQKLISEIKAERIAKVVQSKVKKPLLNEHYTTFSIDVDENIPKGWLNVKICDVTDCLDYLRRPVNKEERQKRPGKIPYYGANGKVGNIDDYIFDEELVVIVEDETFLGREIPFSYIIRGKTWVNNHAHVLRPLGGISVEYLNICFSYYDFTPLTSGTTGRRKLTQGALLNATFFIAPIEEQKEIVRKVEELFTTPTVLKHDTKKQKTGSIKYLKPF